MYEYIDNSIEEFKKKTQKTFNNSRLSLLKFDEINLLQVKRESNRLYKRLRKQSELFYSSLIQYLAVEMDFDANEYSLEHFLTAFSPVLLYSFETEADRKQARHFESIVAIGDMSDSRVLEEQKKEIRYWCTQVEEIAVDIEREIFISQAKKHGVKYVRWVTKRDERVCIDCADLNGQVFKIDDVPRRPHIGCRCWLERVGGDFDAK